jgi:site-specific recombinase XerD
MAKRQRRYKTPKEEWVAEMREELGSRKVRKALEEGRKLPFPLTFQEVLDCMEAAKTERDRLMVRVLYASGVRREELAQLQVCHVRFEECSLFIADGKYGKDRVIIVDRKTIKLLEEYTLHMAKDRTVFGICGKQIWRLVKACGIKAGVAARYTAGGRHFGPHAFRHAYATNSFNNGMPPPTLQWLMGHEHLQTTQIYIYMDVVHARDVYNRTHDFALLDQIPMATPAPVAAAVQIVHNQPRYDLAKELAERLFEGEGAAQGAD